MSDILFPTPGNPLPEGAEAGYFEGRGRTKLRYARFPATGRPLKGTVLVLSGRNEAIEKYFETIADLQARGFAVTMFDWRGQGGSQRAGRWPRRSYARSFGHHVEDIDRFISDILLPDCRPPYYVLAHSTGALIALQAAPVLQNRIRRMVLCAPLLTIARLPFSMTTLARLSGFLTTIGLGRLYLAQGLGKPAGFETNVVTSDPDRFARNRQIFEAHPELGLGPTTAGWLRAACRAMAMVRERRFLRGFRIPVLLVAAGADRVVSTPAIEDYAGHLRGAALVTIDGAQHELLQERDVYREQFWAAFDAFVPGEGAETDI